MADVLPGCVEILRTRNGVAAGAVTGGVLVAVTGNRNTALNGAVIGYYSDKQTANRADAAKKYNYAAGGDRPEIDSATLTPRVRAVGRFGGG